MPYTAGGLGGDNGEKGDGRERVEELTDLIRVRGM
jgi:hypothetical protein